MKRRHVPVLLSTLVLALSSPSIAAFKSKGEPEVGFVAVGPAGLKINGKTSKLTAVERDEVLSVKVPLTNLETGIGLRDKHLRKYLDVAKYPTAALNVRRSQLKVPEDGKSSSGRATGAFTLHGTTKQLPFKYQMKRKGPSYWVRGTSSLDIRDYGIEVPCYLGICVEPTVKLDVKFQLEDR